MDSYIYFCENNVTSFKVKGINIYWPMEPENTGVELTLLVPGSRVLTAAFSLFPLLFSVLTRFSGRLSPHCGEDGLSYLDSVPGNERFCLKTQSRVKTMFLKVSEF